VKFPNDVWQRGLISAIKLAKPATPSEIEAAAEGFAETWSSRNPYPKGSREYDCFQTGAGVAQAIEDKEEER
jgi:hypothetical protein